MILRGVIENTFRGALCFRGFAKIGDLAKLSYVKNSYQRKVDEKRSENILEFLKNGTYRFFPELIFGLQFNDTKAIENILNGRNFIPSSDNIKFNSISKDFKDYQTSDKFDSPLLRRVSFEFTKNDHPYLSRIDGNHRLSAVDNLSEEESSDIEKLNYLVPFCIILQAKSHEAEKYETAYFHLINATAKPLTSEENLKVIIDDINSFPDDELKTILGISGVKTRELINKVQPDLFTGIKRVLENQYRTYYLEIFKRLLDEDIPENELVNKVFESLKEIDVIYNNNDELKANSSFGLLTTFLFYHVKGNKTKFKFFKDWIIDNHIFKVPETSADSLIKIFDKITENNIKIFVAMPYFSKDEVSSYNNTYEKVITEIKEEYPHLNIEQPISIMQNEGKTFDLLTDILNKIKECSIFIADLSQINVNVIYELGYSRSLNIPTILVCRQEDWNKIPFDIGRDSRRSYNPLAHSTLEDVLKKDIKAILSKDYGFIIEKKK